MLASVIIPVYHGAATLARTLQGFLTQEVNTGERFDWSCVTTAPRTALNKSWPEPRKTPG